MASYEEWNKAIVVYFVSGLPEGASVYLSVDEQSLRDIGKRFKGITDPVQDFLTAVRSKCVYRNRVSITEIRGLNSVFVPQSVAFLGAMVLAAHFMAEEETERDNISEINYFCRLRQVLGLNANITGRPEGLTPAGIEECLWLEWNQWIIQNGWYPSAEQGESIIYRYINYPLSQALLREGDKERLERLLRKEEMSSRLGRNWDREKIGVWLQSISGHFNSKHLNELFLGKDPRRIDAAIDAVYDVYTSIDWDSYDIDFKRRDVVPQRRIIAGLYRTEDPIWGEIEYFLYPRQPKRWQGSSLEIAICDEYHKLISDRSGWFCPLWMEDPAGGKIYKIIGDPQITELFLPERQFWLLVRDRENPESGIYATWGQPGLGETFIVLCQQQYREQMDLFKQEGLLIWNDEIELVFDSKWIEYHECMILSSYWDGVIPQFEDFYQSLKPLVKATISLKGGLRLPRQRIWLDGYEPEISVISFEDYVRLEIQDLSNRLVVFEEVIPTNRPIPLRLEPGDYYLVAYLGNQQVARQSLKIANWESIDIPPVENYYYDKVGV